MDQLNIQKRVKFNKFLNFFLAIIFDLDNTLVKSAYKNHKLTDYDSYVTVSILGNKQIRVKY